MSLPVLCLVEEGGPSKEMGDWKLHELGMHTHRDENHAILVLCNLCIVDLHNACQSSQL